MLFNGYNPYSHHGTKPAPTEACDVPLYIFQAAKDIKAMCLSADGRTAYRIRMGEIEETYWNEEKGSFGRSWWRLADASDFPAGAVRM